MRIVKTVRIGLSVLWAFALTPSVPVIDDNGASTKGTRREREQRVAYGDSQPCEQARTIAMRYNKLIDENHPLNHKDGGQFVDVFIL
ncbi:MULTISPECIES: hypothetical protein [Dickeya]|uniref:hypothetical protein n=1 Tax=Dickeya TaxID=204037 RepID=UPI0031835382